MFRRFYSKTAVRLPLKFLIAFTVSKLIHDWIEYMRLNSVLVIPRTMQMFGAQNALSVPLPQPYLYGDSYEHMQKIKQYYSFQIKQFNSFYFKQHQKQHLFNDHPCRENPDSIDHFIEYGNIYRIKEYINYTFINKLKSEGIDIPEGINQRIRQLEQYKLEFHCPIVPLL